MCAAADGSLWTPVVRPISVPVVSRRSPVPIIAGVRDARAAPRQMSPFESRRATSLHSLPHGRTGMNGPEFVDVRRSAGSINTAGPPSDRPRSVGNIDLYSLPHGRSGMIGPEFVEGRRSASGSNARLRNDRPRSVQNVDLRPVRLSPDQSLLQVPSRTSVEDQTTRLSPLRFTDDYRRSLPRNVGHAVSLSAWSAPGEWSQDQQNESLLQLDRERSRSLSADRRKYFPPLRQDRSFRRDERGQHLENTRREVRFIVVL